MSRLKLNDLSPNTPAPPPPPNAVSLLSLPDDVLMRIVENQLSREELYELADEKRDCRVVVEQVHGVDEHWPRASKVLHGLGEGAKRVGHDADFWRLACTNKGFLFSPAAGEDYMPFGAVSNLDRWRKQYRMFCEIATNARDRQRMTHLAALRALGSREEIEKGAFDGCTALALVALPVGIRTIRERAFAGCTSLALTALPARLRRINPDAFAGCTSLALTALPEQVAKIGARAFAGCTSLALTALPERVTEIKERTFAGCTALALTALPEGLGAIYHSGFAGCTSLAITALPKELKWIGVDAFLGCPPAVQALAQQWESFEP